MRITMPTKYSTNTSEGDKKASSSNKTYADSFVHQNYSSAKNYVYIGNIM